jgi:thioredoxin reductase
LGVVPNTEFVPANLKNEGGHVMVDEFLRVKGVEGVWAAGDVVDIQASQLVYTGEFSIFA